MINKIMEMLGIKRRKNMYKDILQATLESQRDIFREYKFNPETKTMNLETATHQELSTALEDCRRCIATEYPETEEGTLWAIARSAEIQKTIDKRRENWEMDPGLMWTAVSSPDINWVCKWYSHLWHRGRCRRCGKRAWWAKDQKYTWHNRFNNIEQGGPFASEAEARKDALVYYIQQQSGFAFDIEIACNGNIISEGHMKDGEWFDGEFTETEEESAARLKYDAKRN